MQSLASCPWLSVFSLAHRLKTLAPSPFLTVIIFQSRAISQKLPAIGTDLDQ